MLLDCKYTQKKNVNIGSIKMLGNSIFSEKQNKNLQYGETKQKKGKKEILANKITN